MANRIQLRRDTAANWASVNPVLAQGEVGIVTDAIPIQIKVGNGVTAWNSLSYVATGNMDVAGSTLDDLVDGTTYKRIRAALAVAINNETRLPTVAGKVAADDVGSAPGINTGEKLVGKITEAGYSLAHATGADNLDNIADGVNYKRVTAAEKGALTAGYTHLQQLADAEAASGADTSAKIKTLLGNASESNYGVVKLASNGVATAGRAVEAIDNRLSDDRTPKTHQSTHRIGGTDALPLAAQNLPGLMELTPGLAVITALFSKVGGQSPSSLLSFNGIYLGSSKIADIVKTPLVILSGGCPTDYVL